MCAWRWGSCQLLNYWNKGKFSKALYLTLVPFHLMNDPLMSLFEIIITKAITFLIIWMNTKHYKEKLWEDLIHAQQMWCCSQQVVYMCVKHQNHIHLLSCRATRIPQCLFKKLMYFCWWLGKLCSHCFLADVCPALDFPGSAWHKSEQANAVKP